MKYNRLKMHRNSNQRLLFNAEIIEAYRKLSKLLQTPTEIMEVFKALIFGKDNVQPLIDGSTNRVVSSYDIHFFWFYFYYYCHYYTTVFWWHTANKGVYSVVPGYSICSCLARIYLSYDFRSYQKLYFLINTMQISYLKLWATQVDSKPIQ